MSRARLLLITPEGDISAEFELQGQNIVIGRSPQSNIIIADSDISRSHSQIVNTANGFFISDMGSTNGTFLNGIQLEPKQMFQIKSNDQLNLGRVSLLFQVVSNSLPNIDPDATLRFSQNKNKTMAVMQGMQTSLEPVSKAEPALAEAQFQMQKPVYIPQAEHLNIELPETPNLAGDDLFMMQEILGDLPKKKEKQKNSFTTWNLFNPQNAKIINNNNEVWEEEILLKEILGKNEDVQKSNFEKISEMKQFVNTSTIQQTDNYPVLYKAKTAQPQIQDTPAENNSYVIDTESFYYPQASMEQDINKFMPENYSYDSNTPAQKRDPFADLNFRDDDSILSKFNNGQKSMPAPKKTKIDNNHKDDNSSLKKLILPISLVVSAFIIALSIYITNSGVFG